jgi:hypothetical protein
MLRYGALLENEVPQLADMNRTHAEIEARNAAPGIHAAWHRSISVTLEEMAEAEAAEAKAAADAEAEAPTAEAKAARVATNEKKRGRRKSGGKGRNL